MVSLQIEEIKEFTRQLFIGTTFDHFLLREAQIVTFNSFQIDGRIRPDYYSAEEIARIRDACKNPRERAIVEVFRSTGARVGEIAEITLDQLDLETGDIKAQEAFLRDRQTGFASSEVNGLYLNIRYEDKRLSCVTGTSVSRFTLDKTLEHEWDGAVKEFLKKKNIPFEEK